LDQLATRNSGLHHVWLVKESIVDVSSGADGDG
jgi:hypothetical protein